MAGAVVTAQAEGRTVSAESAFADSDGVDEAEEWTSDQLSDAAAVASSVLAQHGALQQVSHPLLLPSFHAAMFQFFLIPLKGHAFDARNHAPAPAQ